MTETAVPGTAVPEPAVPAPSVRRRGRTALLIAGAAALGLVAGTCAGYLVQADRAPTKLPSLSQPALAQAKGNGPQPLSAAQDHKAMTDGDLRELLLKRPGNARKALYTVGNDGWMSLADYADTFKKPQHAFGNLIGEEFRRTAVTNWREGSTYNVEIRLIQYRQEEKLAAHDAADDAYYWAEQQGDADSWPVPGTGDGMAYVHHKPEREAGYVDVYEAEAHAWRGDIAMEVWVFDTKPIPKKKIVDLAKRQMERL
ncbi:hypothetical protein ABZ864_32135 [Streptomyces sp. NPDC047082]|uniref:hypothetical protein n=1 Tax=Streptomyces sp. NPDC047082 TaxID=3155259 RepID=UPI0033C02F12